MLHSMLQTDVNTISILQERIDAVEEVLEAGSANLIKLRTLLKGLPDLVKGLCRIQYGKVATDIRECHAH
jgi:DNA mismatch repair protein MSH3